MHCNCLVLSRSSMKCYPPIPIPHVSSATIVCPFALYPTPPINCAPTPGTVVALSTYSTHMLPHRLSSIPSSMTAPVRTLHLQDEYVILMECLKAMKINQRLLHCMLDGSTEFLDACTFTGLPSMIWLALKAIRPLHPKAPEGKESYLTCSA